MSKRGTNSFHRCQNYTGCNSAMSKLLETIRLIPTASPQPNAKCGVIAIAMEFIKNTNYFIHARPDNPDTSSSAIQLFFLWWWWWWGGTANHSEQLTWKRCRRPLQALSGRPTDSDRECNLKER